MAVTTIRSLAKEIGVSRWRIYHLLRAGYVSIKRPPGHRKVYLTPGEIAAIKAYFGLVDPRHDRYCQRQKS
jgi:hypothetical protein